MKVFCFGYFYQTEENVGETGSGHIALARHVSQGELYLFPKAYLRALYLY